MCVCVVHLHCVYYSDLLKGETYKVRIAATSQYTTGSYSPWRVVKLPGERKESRDTAENTTSISRPTRRCLFYEGKISLIEVMYFHIHVYKTEF